MNNEMASHVSHEVLPGPGSQPVFFGAPGIYQDRFKVHIPGQAKLLQAHPSLLRLDLKGCKIYANSR